MTYEASSGGSRTVTAYFDSRDHANDAVSKLRSEGFTSVRLIAGNESGATGTTTRAADEDRGFWESLKDLFLPEEDTRTYSEGLRRGGYVVSVATTDADYERALDILDDEGSVDIDERAQSWRSEGWSDTTPGAYETGRLPGTSTGYTGSGDTLGSDTLAAVGTTGTASSLTGGYASDTVAGYASSDTVAAYGSDTLATGREEVIPIVEEELRVGKRDVSHGRVRVRSYVVETPVNEEVSLRDERVSVERRAVDRALTGDEQLFKDRTIEVEERAEEAVIAKDARVREELVINKEVGQRTQTVSDTVRHTEVEVEDERGNSIIDTDGRTKR
ncbi:conserved domain-containing protein [Faunimonas pinastri]|uniref:Conserved domain-containing protein n=1 Tax=Faunimonas pinastri TaxID=1855383 RepID=A0A1H9NLM0_9HYPH|nr:YsnF/AvaK domain-containing protein [Faunimonas pinastri]SER36293.1 conserved domain-containing protein [Faunimonas pinastri]